MTSNDYSNFPATILIVNCPSSGPRLHFVGNLQLPFRLPGEIVGQELCFSSVFNLCSAAQRQLKTVLGRMLIIEGVACRYSHFLGCCFEPIGN